MSGHENVLRNIWYWRFKLARPTADDDAIRRATESVLRDPEGAYAKEIERTAKRRERETWMIVNPPVNGNDHE